MPILYFWSTVEVYLKYASSSHLNADLILQNMPQVYLFVPNNPLCCK